MAVDASGASTKPNSAKAASSRQMVNFVPTPNLYHVKSRASPANLGDCQPG